MKKKTKYALLQALVLCMGVFFTPARALASDGADAVPPTVSVEVRGFMAHIEAEDEAPGVDAVYIAGVRVSYPESGGLDVSLADYAGEEAERVEIYATDLDGNRSETVVVKNPGYRSPGSEGEEKPFTPQGQATVVDNATDGDGKEFYTFTTPDENVFYLVIDRQRDTENVYFLNAVTEDDLAALAEKAGQGGGGAAGSTAPKEEACSCEILCGWGSINTACPACRTDMERCAGEPQEKEPEAAGEAEKSTGRAAGKGGEGLLVFLLLAVLSAGGAGYYLKIYKPRHDLDDAEDLEELLDGDDEEEPDRDALGDDVDMEMQEPEDGEESAWGAADTDGDAALYDDYPDGDDPGDGSDGEG